MSEPMYKCERCGHVFPVEDVFYKRAYDGNPCEDQYLCPNCKSDDLTQGHECEYCGGFYPDDEEYFDGCCHECGENAEDALKAYLVYGKEMDSMQKRIMWDYWGCL